MYFDFDPHRPDTPRMPQAMSLREGVLLSVVVHLLMALLYLLTPEGWLQFRDEPVEAETLLAERQDDDDRQLLRFVEVMPLVDRPEAPDRPADASDMDRRSSTIERPENAIDPGPYMLGNTPEMVEGGPVLPPEPEPPTPPAPEPVERADAGSPEPLDEGDAPVLSLADRGLADLEVPSPNPSPSPRDDTRALSDSLRNLARYLREENYDNRLGGNSQQSAFIQFDSMGVDFGPWLLRFKHQVERNWIVPAAAMTYRGRVVIRFFVLRNGYITDLTVLQPAAIPALTNAAVNALRLSNPTAALPPEYPADRMQIIVTFFYNEDPRTAP
jgi:TonB family protein|nr:MAG: hypothetical protein DIU54_07275 [Acidobacteriota bacterium]